jgi:hypothetical protein
VSGEDACKRCEKPGHNGRRCKAPFSKSWPNRPAMKMLLRCPDGMTIDLTMVLTQEQYERAYQLSLDVWKGTARPADTVLP